MATDYEAMATSVVESVRGFIKRAVAPMVEKQDKTAATVESLERRASRHASHLSELENRMQALERKAGK